MKPQDWSDKCTACGKKLTVKAGWDCEATGGRHIVEEKEFYHLGGKDVAEVRQRRLFAPLLVCKPPKERVDPHTGERIPVDGCMVQFEQSGIFRTDDPEKQFYLLTKYGMPWGPEGRKLWNAVYLTDSQQKTVLADELAEINRQIKERNSVLDGVITETETNEAAADSRRQAGA